VKLWNQTALFLAALALVPLLGLGACNHKIDDATFNLEVSVGVTGDATVTQVVYSGGSISTPVTVDNPTLPFTVQLQAFVGNTVLVQATGTANNGVLSVAITDDPAIVMTPTTYASQDCGPTSPTCSLSVPASF
jgi:hypothetical protein